MSKTKTELEDEIAALKQRIAELEGAIAAYQFALLQRPYSGYVYPASDRWINPVTPYWGLPPVTTVTTS